jgi:hypothetical protein
LNPTRRCIPISWAGESGRALRAAGGLAGIKRKKTKVNRRQQEPKTAEASAVAATSQDNCNSSGKSDGGSSSNKNSTMRQ